MANADNYLNLPLEEVLGERFGRYSKYIIQERALPDVRDGLKPVQRRILYAMNEERNTYDNDFRKAAKTVGTVIGNYHPHGDSSVYDAMARLSQNWKMRNSLVEMHGNNGSIDGDPPAAMRYTEAKLSKIASEMLRDIDKETVDFISNFDDTMTEPSVLPAKMPNLLTNGSAGISAGYATDIPPHNLGEVIDAVIKKIDNPEVTVDELMHVLPGPDFPTGATVQGSDGIRKAYQTGNGKIVIRGRTSIESIRGGREQIVIDEIPYEVNKATMVKKMDELRLNRKVEGLAEVRDETDRTGLRVVVELKKGADSSGILNYLYKNTDLQVSYNFNMVAISESTPKRLSLPEMLDAYITHQKEIVTRRTTHDLNKAKNRAHIVDGLIRAISILDDVIATIRASKDKQDAKKRIIAAFDFSEKQAEAIVTLPLYRLSNTDISQLEQEAESLKKQIQELETLLASDKHLMQHIKDDLKQMKQTFADERRTVIESKIDELTFNIDVTVAKEDVVFSVTRDGYVKQTSIRSYNASNGKDPGIKDDDSMIGLMELHTTDHVLLFTNKGHFIYLPVHELPDIRWKDLGQHISNFASIASDEQIVQSIPVRTAEDNHYLIFFTKNGIVKRSKLNVYEGRRYFQTLIALNLKDHDEVINVQATNGCYDVFIATNTGYGLWYHESEISTVGQRAAGVKSIKLQENEKVVGGQVFEEETEPFIVAVTHRGAVKRMKLQEFTKSERASRGQVMLRALKTKTQKLRGFYAVSGQTTIYLRTSQNDIYELNPFDLAVSSRSGNGSFIIKSEQQGEITDVWREAVYEKPFTD